MNYYCTGRMGWMAHWKWKEAKQLPGTAGPGNMLGCSLIFFHFLWAIHPIRPVHLINRRKKAELCCNIHFSCAHALSFTLNLSSIKLHIIHGFATSVSARA